MASGFHVVGLKSDENRDKHRYKDDQRSKMNATLLFDVQKKVAEKEMNSINASDGGTYISSTQMHCIAVRFLETHVGIISPNIPRLKQNDPRHLGNS